MNDRRKHSELCRVGSCPRGEKDASGYCPRHKPRPGDRYNKVDTPEHKVDWHVAKPFIREARINGDN